MNRNPLQRNVARWTCLPHAVLVVTVLACAGGDRPPSAETAAAETTVAVTPAGAQSGEQVYQVCVTCHQANGEGLAGTFPPLAGSEYVTASNPAVPIRILLRGMQGPVTVRGTQYNGVMPPFGTGVELSDEQVAAVLTYVRTSWGNRASAVTPDDVAKERAAAKAAGGAVTAEELRPLM